MKLHLEMRFLKNLILILFVLTFSLSFQSCTKFQHSKRQETQRRKQFKKDKHKKDREAQQAYKDALKKHYDMQTTGTQKMMRETARKSQNAMEHKKPCFIKRWLTPKQKRGGTKRNTK